MTNRNDIGDQAKGLRRQAEEIAVEEPTLSLEIIHAMSAEEIRRVLHKSQVHQIELEMQNEELRTAQAGIESARARYFDLYDLAPLGYCTLSEEGVILEANLTAATLLGSARSELVTQPLSRFIHCDDQNIYSLHRKQLFETGNLQKCDLRLVQPDGGYIWAHMKGAINRAEDGVLLCRVVISDITDRKQAEKALIESEALFRGMFKEHSAVMLLIEPTTGQIVKANQAAARFYGYPLETMIRMNIQQLNVLSPTEIADKMSSAFNRQVNIFEFRHMLADGQVRDVQVHSAPVTIQNEELLFSIIQDITERRRAEEAVTRSVEDGGILLNTIQTQIWYLTDDGTYGAVNKAHAEFNGLKIEDMAFKDMYDFFPEDVVEVCRQGNVEVFTTAKPVHSEEWVPHFSGERRLISIQRTPRLRADGTVEHVVCAAEDITARKQTEESLRQADEILKTMQMGLYVYELENPADDSSLRMVVANAASGKLTGVSSEELIGKYIDEIFPALRALGIPKRFADIVRTGKTSEFEDLYYADDRVLEAAYAVIAFPLPNHRVGITFDNITDRKRGDEAVLASEEKFRSIFSSMTEIVALHELVCDEDGKPVNYRILDCNPAFTRITGIRCEDAVGRLATDVYGSVTAPYLDEYARVALTGEPCSFITSYAPMDKHFDVHAASPGKNLFVTVTADITERKQAEESLRVSQERLQLATHGTGIGIWDWDIVKNDLVFDDNMLRMYGIEKESFGGVYEGWASRLHPDDKANAEGEIQAALSGDREYSPEFRIVLPDGSVRFISAASQTFRDDQGKPVRMIGVNIDITERKQAEEALNASQAQLSNALEIAHLGHWEYDVATDLFTFNDLFYNIFRTTVEQVGGYTMHSAEYARRFVHPDDFDMVREEIQKAIGTTDPLFNEQIDHRILYADGTPGNITVRFLIVKDSYGRTVKTYGVNQDITERKQTEDALQDSLAEKEVLLREVHHRVKNNMAAIIGLFNLQRQAIEDPQVRAVLADLSSRVRAMSLVHEKLYRSESLAKIDFQDYLQSLISHLRTSFGSPNIECEIAALGVELPLDLAVPCGMIINELVINAMKHAFPLHLARMDEKVDTITVAAHRDHDTFSLCVADNGVGLPPGFDLNSAETLGLVLVRMLGGHQLGGVYEIEQLGGTRVTLTFSLHNGRMIHE